MTDEIQPTFNDVTREQFERYIEIQESGEYNMMDLRGVEMASDFELDRTTQRLIHKHYDELKGKYNV